ncbi:MAG: metallophosphoesterase [Desulfobulbaceae bacterium]|nr:metallophosphoesterase [Desulfobulbaceae bacterium]
MNILHISDLHFGTRHWDGNDQILLDKLNSYSADLVVNTGDSTSDSLESEFKDAEKFLRGIRCDHLISIAGNHDKRNMHSHEYFKRYISISDRVLPLKPEQTVKRHLYLQKDITRLDDHFTDLNYIKLISIGSVTVLIVCLDSTVLYEDEGYVEKEILKSFSLKIKHLEYDKSILLIHHSILTMDEEPLRSSFHVTDFVRKHQIKDIFCGHTHRLDLQKSSDLYLKNSFTQYMVGTLSSSNRMGNDNQFLYLKNWGTAELQIHLIRIFLNDGVMSFREELI